MFDINDKKWMSSSWRSYGRRNYVDRNDIMIVMFLFFFLDLMNQVAVKNNIDVFYFAVVIPLSVFFAEDGQMDKRIFLSTWKDIPAQNEVQYTINNVSLSADAVSAKMQQNNVFTIAKRNVEGQDMLYQSLKLVNGIWILSELKMQPGNPNLILAVKTRAPDVSSSVHTAFDAILHS